MKVWRLSNCENFVGKREELVLDAFSDCMVGAEQRSQL